MHLGEDASGGEASTAPVVGPLGEAGRASEDAKSCGGDVPSFSRSMTHAAMSAACGQLRHCEAADVDRVLGELAAGDAYSCLVAVKVCSVALMDFSDGGEQRSAPRRSLLALMGHASPHVAKAACRWAAERIVDDDCLLARFEDLSWKSQRAMVRAVASRRGPDGARRVALARRLVPLATKHLGVESCGALYKVAPPARVDELDPAVARRVRWQVVARSRPEVVLEHFAGVCRSARPWALRSALEQSVVDVKALRWLPPQKLAEFAAAATGAP